MFSYRLTSFCGRRARSSGVCWRSAVYTSSHCSGRHQKICSRRRLSWHFLWFRVCDDEVVLPKEKAQHKIPPRECCKSCVSVLSRTGTCFCLLAMAVMQPPSALRDLLMAVVSSRCLPVTFDSVCRYVCVRGCV